MVHFFLRVIVYLWEKREVISYIYFQNIDEDSYVFVDLTKIFSM